MVTIIRRNEATYQVVGQVIEKRTRRGIAGVAVEARDRDTRYHDMLGQTHTDEQGGFRIGFEPEDFGDFAPDHAPDLFFRLSIDGEQVLDTMDRTMENLAPGRTSVTLELDRQALPEPKADRVGVAQLVKAVDWLRTSDFKGVLREGQGKAGTLGGVLGTQAARLFKAWDFAPVRPSGTQEAAIVGQPLQQAQSALAVQRVTVAEVREVDKRSTAVLRTLGDVPLTLKAGDRVVLYQEGGIVKYYTREAQKNAATIDQQAVAGLGAEVQQLKTQALEVETLRGAVDGLRSAGAAQEQRVAEDAATLRARSLEVDQDRKSTRLNSSHVD